MLCPTPNYPNCNDYRPGLRKLMSKNKDGWIYKCLTSPFTFDLCPEDRHPKATEGSKVPKYRIKIHWNLEIPKITLECAKESFYFSAIIMKKDISKNFEKENHMLVL